MSPPNRRQFIRHAADSLWALGAYPFTLSSADCNTSDARTQTIHRFDAGAIRSLASKINGHLVTPEEPDYGSARLVFNRAFDRHPALIIYCGSASDVRAVLNSRKTETFRSPCAVADTTELNSAAATTA